MYQVQNQELDFYISLCHILLRGRYRGLCQGLFQGLNAYQGQGLNS
jgi:hypothetical protein